MSDVRVIISRSDPRREEDTDLFWSKAGWVQDVNLAMAWNPKDFGAKVLAEALKPPQYHFDPAVATAQPVTTFRIINVVSPPCD